MIRVLSAVSLAALLLAAPVFAADGDRLPYPDPGRPYNYQLAADGDQLPALQVAADGDEHQALQPAVFLAGANDRIGVPDDDYLKTLSI